MIAYNSQADMHQYMGNRRDFFKYKTKKLSEQAVNKRLKYEEQVKENRRVIRISYPSKNKER